MSWFNWEFWRGKVFTARDRDSPLYAGGDDYGWAGEAVTAETAKKVSAWFRCQRLYADVTGTLPLKFYRRAENDERVPAPEHPVARIISSEPNADNTSQEFWSSQAVGLCTRGDSYAEKIQANDGRLISLELLPFDTYPYRNLDGELRYRSYDFVTRKEIDLPREKVFHIRHCYEFGDRGTSPLAAARRSLAIALATERSVSQTFSRGMRAKGFFTVPQLLTQPQRDQAKKVLIDPLSGPQGADWGILEAGFDVKTININPKDAEMMLNRRFNVEDICRFMGVPPILVGHAAEGQTMWGTGVENIISSWRTIGLDAFLSTIEKAINRWLLNAAERRELYAEFDRDGLMQGDSAARGALLAQMVQNAQLTPNEGRKKQNRPSLGPDGDKPLVNSTLIPLADAGRPEPASPAPPPKAKVMQVTKHDAAGRISETVTREVEES